MEPSVSALAPVKERVFEPGDKVRVTFPATVDLVDGQYMDVIYMAPGNLLIEVPVIGDTEGMSVVPVGEPTLYERTLTTLADRAVDLEAAAKRCDAVERPGLAIEHRTGAEAVRMGLVSVIGLGGVNLDEAIGRAHALIAEAVKRRG